MANLTCNVVSIGFQGYLLWVQLVTITDRLSKVGDLVITQFAVVLEVE